MQMVVSIFSQNVVLLKALRNVIPLFMILYFEISNLS